MDQIKLRQVHEPDNFMFTENEDKQHKRKRRSKNEVVGRNFVCDCGKSYLSAPALTNHKKTKHNTEETGIKRSRGRPRKNVYNTLIKASVYPQSLQGTEQKFRNFLDLEQRIRAPFEKSFILTDYYEYIFEEIYIKYNNFLPTHYATITDNPFFAKIKENINLEKKENNDKNCDEVFYEYLKVLANKCNHKYFIFAFKFVVLFRECLNKFKLNEKDVSKEYTQCNNSDQVPDLCNEFINDFMEGANFFGLNNDEDKIELIEIIQHYCFWLFDNGYTTSRLSLLTN